MNVEGRGRARVLDSLARIGDPSPSESARRLRRAWRLFVESGVPQDPGWHAAAHALDDTTAEAKATKGTDAMAHAGRLLRDVHKLAGVLVWSGGVGSGRSYAAARLLWSLARRCARGLDVPMGRWVNGPDLGVLDRWVDRGSGARSWPTVRAALLRPQLLIIDDMGAEGSTKDAYERARDLAQLRQSKGTLTIITTNVRSPGKLADLLGGRVHSRAQIDQVSGGDLRTHKLEQAPPVPALVQRAHRCLSAADALDECLRAKRWGDRGEAVSKHVEGWLSAGVEPKAWGAKMQAHAALLERRGTELDAALSSAVERLLARANPEPEPDPTPGMRESHQEKLASLAKGKSTADLREALAALSKPETATECRTLEAIRQELVARDEPLR